MTPGFSAQLNASLPFVQGETWGGILLITITVGGAVPSANAASAKMQFRTTKESSDTLVSLSTADATITMTSAVNWTFVVPPQLISLPFLASPYWWGFQVTDVNGVALTYLEGEQVVLPKAVY